MSIKIVPDAPGARSPSSQILVPVVGTGTALINVLSGGYASIIVKLYAVSVPVF